MMVGFSWLTHRPSSSLLFVSIFPCLAVPDRSLTGDIHRLLRRRPVTELDS